MFKGDKEVVLNRTTAQFFLNHPVSKLMLSWMADVAIPDEAFYATMSRVRVRQDYSFYQELRNEDNKLPFCFSPRSDSEELRKASV